MVSFLRLIPGFVVLTSIYLVSTWLMAWLHLPFPGSLFGLLLCAALIRLRVLPLRWVEGAANGLLVHLPLFYLPFVAAIGQFWPLFRDSGPGLVGVVVTVTGIVVISTGFAAERLAREVNHPHVDSRR